LAFQGLCGSFLHPFEGQPPGNHLRSICLSLSIAVHRWLSSFFFFAPIRWSVEKFSTVAEGFVPRKAIEAGDGQR
jgi:hypothetical protein